MITITVGLKVSDSIQSGFIYSPHLKKILNKGPDWDEDSCSNVSKLSLTSPADDAYCDAAGQPDWQKTSADCTTSQFTEGGCLDEGPNWGVYLMAHSEC